MVKIGCCGFPVARDKYYGNFTVVEIQKTFYQLPPKTTVERWRKEAPKQFEFCLKAWQLITHNPSSPTYRKLKLKIKDEKLKNYGSFKPTDEVFSAWEATSQVAQALKAKIVLFQSPASFRPTPEHKGNLKRFFRTIQDKDYILAWEPRGEWLKEDILRLCKQLNLVHCVDPFQDKPLYGGIRYYRLHGKDGYNYRYTQEDLQFLKRRLTMEKMPTYLMFNNVYMFADAIRFKNSYYTSGGEG